MHHEPEAGAQLEAGDFENVIRLTPLVSIDMIVRSSDGRVLLGRRNHEPAKGCFFVPGGRITKNETLAAAFRRISRAELGVDKKIEEARFWGVYEHFYLTNRLERAGLGTHYVVLAYELTSPVEDALLPKEQHGEYAWQTEAELLNCSNVHENTKAYFRQPSNDSAHRAGGAARVAEGRAEVK
ncbi:MAG: GDP-mannose mannosyl hydrolase [Verrucomicrobiota bacterium]|jgi:colanic acid biosynthesis protein WcaH